MNDPRFDLPPDLPVPLDDGAASHLAGISLPPILLSSTRSGEVNISQLDRAIIFIYPRTGTPSLSPGSQWDIIPGARGCTPQSCGFRDLSGEFAALGVNIFGLSTQTTEYQREMSDRLGLPFEVLSDSKLELTHALRLPTFEFDIEPIGGGGPSMLIKRMTWWIREGRIEHVWYPVFPPDQSASVVLAFLNAGGRRHQ
jgi:peroxiredoxin